MKRVLPVVACLVLAAAVFPLISPTVRAEEELPCPAYMSVVDEGGQHLMYTGHLLRPGDEFLAADNRRYRVIRVEERRAVARLIGQENLEALLTPADEEAIAQLFRQASTETRDRETAGRPSMWSRFAYWQEKVSAALRLNGGQEPAAAEQKVVGIYHTHGDESYEPNQGTSSVEGKGGVFHVGSALASKLREKGLTPIHDKTLYLPHDGMAYERSRRGAASLAAARPLAIFDVHRDSGPAQDYVSTIDGQKVSRVMIVIGRQNPSTGANSSFAERLKAAADRLHPGLVRGILYAQGKFNQDIHPRNLLIEVGTEKVTQEMAERGAALLADAVPLAAGAVAPAIGGGREAGAALRSLLWIVGLSAAAGGLYLWLSTGSWQEARRKLQGWLGEMSLGGRDRGDRRDGER